MRLPLELLLGLFAQFALLSLVAFGGANSVVPEMQRLAVESHHWMSDKEFTALFAISQSAPGPNLMVATLVGWKVAGVGGALVATVAICGPSCLLTYWAAKAWDRRRNSAWGRAIASGLAPVTVGMVSATAWLLLRAADLNLRLGAISAATAIVAYFTRLNPLWCLAAAAGLGLSGFL